MSIPTHPTFASLANWLEAPSPSRALILEDGGTGSGSPLARWLEGVVAAGAHEVISASMGPKEALFLERDILVKLYVELYPDEREVPATLSLAELRDQVRVGLRAGEGQAARLVALDRASWAEASFRRGLGSLLGALRYDQKVVVSVRMDDGREPDLVKEHERLGWRPEETLCLRLPAWPDGEIPRREPARERILALGEAALHGETQGVPPYVIEHYGSLLGEHGGLEAQLPLVSETWANAWAPLGNPLGFEADVARVWLAAERELLAKVSAPAQERTAPILAIFRCVQVSRSVMSRVPGLPTLPGELKREPKPGNTAVERAAALAGLAEELLEPQRTHVRECAIDALLIAGPTVTTADLLVQLGRRLEGERREIIARKAVDMYRAEAADWAGSIWLLRSVPLLSTADRRALYAEVVAGIHEFPHYDAAILHEALAASPPDMAPQLTQAIHALAEPDRSRFQCALAPYLEGDAQQRIVQEVLDKVDANPYSLGAGEVRSLAPVLDAGQLSRLGRALQRAYTGDLAAICMKVLCARGHVAEAESLAGPDLGSMPFDWVLALAAGSSDRRSELRAELTRRLSAMDAVALGWAIDRDASELGAVLGVDALLRFARTILAGEEQVVARVALVPFASEEDKRALVTEAVRAFFTAPPGEESLYKGGLLSCWKWMSIPDACHLLARDMHESDALWTLKDFAALLKHLAGPDAPSKMAEQIIEIGRWMP